MINRNFLECKPIDLGQGISVCIHRDDRLSAAKLLKRGFFFRAFQLNHFRLPEQIFSPHGPNTDALIFKFFMARNHLNVVASQPVPQGVRGPGHFITIRHPALHHAPDIIVGVKVHHHIRRLAGLLKACFKFSQHQTVMLLPNHGVLHFPQRFLAQRRAFGRSSPRRRRRGQGLPGCLPAARIRYGSFGLKSDFSRCQADQI